MPTYQITYTETRTCTVEINAPNPWSAADQFYDCSADFLDVASTDNVEITAIERLDP